MTRIDQFDTITAVSTPPGAGAIGIVRLSGPRAEEIGRMLFNPHKAPERFDSHRLYHGDLVNPRSGRTIDEVLLTLMRGPHSYTGEDVLEIHCHGGPAVMQSVLEETLRAGARIARPGEFTERAYLNGRLDLAQAEAVMEIIQAGTDQGREQALSHLKGKLSGAVTTLRFEVIDLLALIEAAIDFPEEDTGSEPGALADRIESVLSRIEELLATYRRGRLFTGGMDLVIAGKSNVGKSSLLNRLLGEERAIVTEVAGTTRDFIAETIDIEGIPVRLTDTAGIRDSDDEAERKGIEKVWERIEGADLNIVVFDGSAPADAQDRAVIQRVLDTSGAGAILAAINKADLEQKLAAADVRALLPGCEPVLISAKYGEGIEALKRAIYEAAMGSAGEHRADAVISSVRHKDALEKARNYLNAALENVNACLGMDLIACDLREAAASLGDIIGETTSEDVLERIFSTFCIGK